MPRQYVMARLPSSPDSIGAYLMWFGAEWQLAGTDSGVRTPLLAVAGLGHHDLDIHDLGFAAAFTYTA